MGELAEVKMVFLGQDVCDLYDFIPKPDIEAIRPTIKAMLLGHDDKTVNVKANGGEATLLLSKISRIRRTDESYDMFENEPFYKLYKDNIHLGPPVKFEEAVKERLNGAETEEVKETTEKPATPGKCADCGRRVASKYLRCYNCYMKRKNDGESVRCMA